ncbi:hypothetical protein [Candidatus Xianfuyuplasma coldseepsis]|uniref:Uncharacterized protein n=1 Tax=Candidatus Xianfuyuplasma coldseepsis TaxID=2782163 RepID=A0A7L7KRK9_9MOLU|nr:hypothetical protein [Xianfuyuplasma coldseepsis]QMS85347.1 hypothetical protein G4Z02_06135 [Xianfuyuplasma coldseepsis]
MIKRNQDYISKFLVILAIIIFLDVMNVIMNLYINVNDELGINVVDMLFIIKLIGSISLFAVLLRWASNKDNTLQKQQLVIHTIYVILVSMFYFFIMYLFKYSIILNAMDILRNKMIDGNPATLLNFAIYTYNTLKFVKSSYQGFNSEFILMLQIVFLVWHLRNLMTLDIEEEETEHYDDFLFVRGHKFVALAMIIVSFLSINIFEYIYDPLEAVMFLVSSFIFTIQIPIFLFLNRIWAMDRNHTLPSEFKTFYKVVNVLLYVTVIGLGIYLGIQVIALSQGSFSYRFFMSVAGFITSFYMLLSVNKIRSLIV